MGQDDSCGICGKHCQMCSHFRKEHISEQGKARCGAKGDLILMPHNWKDIDIDPDNICLRCLNKKKTAKP